VKTSPHYRNQAIAVLGLGSSGLAAARRLLEEGARVTVLESNRSGRLEETAASLRRAGAAVLLGPEAEAGREPFDLAILSPGIDPVVPLVRGFRERGVPIIGELELAWSLCACPVVAITGTNGKTTTTQLIDRMFNAAGVRSRAAGNIGPAFSAEVGASGELDVMTIEASSFQLETITTFRPAVSVWLNFRPDHLDRYPDMEAYRAAKWRIFENQTAEDTAVVKLGEPLPPLAARTITFSATERGADLEWHGGVIHFHGAPVLRQSETRLRGPHNAENLMAALAVGAARGLDFAPMTEALATYTSLPHRYESVRVLDGVEYINDSKATNLDALEKALLSEPRPVVLIAGGKDKGFAFDELTALVGRKARVALLIGEMAERIAASWGGATDCRRAASLEEAVALARETAREGEVVLLSPGTSSFDMFASYADRGNRFRNLVLSQPTHPKPSHETA